MVQQQNPCLLSVCETFTCSFLMLCCKPCWRNVFPEEEDVLRNRNGATFFFLILLGNLNCPLYNLSFESLPEHQHLESPWFPPSLHPLLQGHLGCSHLTQGVRTKYVRLEHINNRCSDGFSVGLIFTAGLDCGFVFFVSWGCFTGRTDDWLSCCPRFLASPKPVRGWHTGISGPGKKENIVATSKMIRQTRSTHQLHPDKIPQDVSLGFERVWYYWFH